MSYDAGSIVGTLDVTRTPFQAGLKAARKEAERFERDSIEVPLRVNPKGLRAQLDAAKKQLAARAALRVPVGADLARARADIAAWRKQVAAGSAAKLPVGADLARARATIAEFRRAVAAGPVTRLPVTANTAQAKREAAIARRDIAAMSAHIRVGANTSQARAAAHAAARDIGGQRATILVTANVGRALGMTGLVTAGLAAISAGVGPAVAALAAIPAAAGIAGQAIAALGIGFSGVGGAMQALEARQKTAATGATAALGQVQGATQALEDTQRQAARTGVQGDEQMRQARVAYTQAVQQTSRQVQQAEAQLGDAQRDARRAQEELNSAREQARTRLRDYRLELSGAALDEESAVLGLRRAEQQLAALRAQQGQSPGSVAPLDMTEADLAVRQARQSLAETRQSNKDLRREATAAARAGVEGDAGVVTARQRVGDASRAVLAAERDLRVARVDGARDVAEAQRQLTVTQQEVGAANADAARAIVRAQQQVQEALRGSGAAAGAAGSQLFDEFSKASPAAQQFARFLENEFLPNMRQIKTATQATMLPRMETALRNLTKLTPTLKTGFAETGKVMGDLAIQGSKMVTSGPWQRDIGTLMAGNNRILQNFGQSGLALADAFRHISIAAQPMIERFSKWARTAAQAFAENMQGARNSGELSRFFKQAGDTLAQFGHILGQIVTGLWNLSRALGPLGMGLFQALGWLVQWLGRLSETNPQLVQVIASTLIGASALIGFGKAIAGVTAALTIAKTGYTTLLRFMGVLPSEAGKVSPLVRAFTALQGAAKAAGAAVVGAVQRIAASRFGTVISGLGSTVAAWARARTAAVTSAAGQVAASMRTNLIKFGGLVAANTAAAASWARARTASFLSMIRQGINAARVNAIRFGGLIASHAQLAAAWVRSGLTAVVSGARQKAAAVAMGIARAATWAMTIAQRALNVAMRANPLGLLITALVAIGAALVTAYKKSEGFRNIVDKIGDVFEWIWKNIIGPFWRNVLKPLFDGIGWVIKKGGEFFEWVGSLFGASGGEVKPRGNAQGAIMQPMAAGGVLGMAGGAGLTPMAPKAQAVPPNTWRVVGDRLRGREFYIPDNGSARSLGILAEAAKAFGMGLAPMQNGGALRPSAAASFGAAGSASGGGASAAVQVDTTGASEGVAALSGSVGALTGTLGPLAAQLMGTTVPALEAVQQQAGTDTKSAVDTLATRFPPLATSAIAAGQRMRQAGAATTQATQRHTTQQSVAHNRMATTIGAATGRIRNQVGLTQRATGQSWQTMTNRSGAAVRTITGQHFNALTRGLGGVRASFANTTAWVRDTWSRIRGYTAGPVRYAIGTPLNAMIGAWNKLDREFKLNKHVQPLRIGFASGGEVPGTGTGDKVPAALTPHEVVWDTRAVRNAGGPAAVDAMRLGYRSGRLNRDSNPARHEVTGQDRQRAMRKAPLDDLPKRLAYGGVMPHVASAGKLIERLFGPLPGGIGGVGSRPNASDHPRGLALDFMTLGNRRLGDRIAGYLLAQSQRLGIKYLIWKQMYNQGDGWSRMEDRGSITANHFDHVHASFLGGGQGGRAFSGAGMPLFDPAALVRGKFAAAMKQAKGIGGKFPGTVGSLVQGITVQAINRAQKAGEKRLNEALMSSVDVGGAGVARWAPVVLRALKIMGQPASLLPVVLRRMNQESGGNPRAFNGWDSNAAAGTPSVGLMQVIGTTYQSNKHPQFDVGPYIKGTSINPLANILASMRYALGRYGSLAAAYNKPGGYRDGGMFLPGQLAFNETRRPEYILNQSQWDAIGQGRAAQGLSAKDLRAFAAAVAEAVQSRPANQVTVTAPPSPGARELVDTLMFSLRHSGKGVHT